jgi:hypothetical protein
MDQSTMLLYDPFMDSLKKAEEKAYVGCIPGAVFV